MNKEKNILVAKAIEKYGQKHDALTDARIYFNGMAWNYDSGGKKTVMEDIKGSQYFEYANDDTVAVSTEGMLSGILNMHFDFSKCIKLIEELDKELEKHGCYYEMGNHWNFSIYYS